MGYLERARNIVGIPTQHGSEGYYPEGVGLSYKRGRPAGFSMRVMGGIRSAAGRQAQADACCMHGMQANAMREARRRCVMHEHASRYSDGNG